MRDEITKPLDDIELDEDLKESIKELDPSGEKGLEYMNQISDEYNDNTSTNQPVPPPDDIPFPENNPLGDTDKVTELFELMYPIYEEMNKKIQDHDVNTNGVPVDKLGEIPCATCGNTVMEIGVFNVVKSRLHPKDTSKIYTRHCKSCGMISFHTDTMESIRVLL